jgi:hypothetical protein
VKLRSPLKGGRVAEEQDSDIRADRLNGNRSKRVFRSADQLIRAADAAHSASATMRG